MSVLWHTAVCIGTPSSPRQSPRVRKFPSPGRDSGTSRRHSMHDVVQAASCAEPGDGCKRLAGLPFCLSSPRLHLRLLKCESGRRRKQSQDESRGLACPRAVKGSGSADTSHIAIASRLASWPAQRAPRAQSQASRAGHAGRRSRRLPVSVQQRRGRAARPLCSRQAGRRRAARCDG